MSEFSNKCDFADTIEIRGVENILKSNIYIGNNIVPLRTESYHDLIPYAAFMVGISTSTNGVGNIWLSSESYVDTHEREILGWYQRDTIKFINKCKRKKIVPEFENMSDFMKEYNKPQKEEIFTRVLNKDMSLDGIHLPMSDHYRKNLYDEMLKAGWDEFRARIWCFGWRDDYKEVRQ